MGALIFYTAVYFIGYYATYLLNQMVGRILIHNRRMAGLIFVLTFGMAHGYRIISAPPPHDHADGARYAIDFYVIMPVAIIVIAVLYLMWQEKNNDDP